MADPKAPSMPVSGDNSCFIRFIGCPRSPVPLAEIRDKLFRFYGLHIVSEADRKVLEGIQSASAEQLRWWVEHEFPGHWLRDTCEAELARRIDHLGHAPASWEPVT